jgi:hypothetical protein
MVVSNSYCGVCFVLFVFVLWKAKHTTIAVGHHHTQEEEKQNKTHTTIAAGHHHTQDEGKQNKTHHNSCPTAIVVCFVLFFFFLCMVVSNSYCGVFCFVCLRVVYGGVQQLLWCVFCFSSS